MFVPAVARVTLERTQHGPIERLSFSRTARSGAVAQLSVYRVGDLLVDTGGTPVGEALVAALADRPPRRIVLTHQHEDHVGNIGALRRAFGDLPVHAPCAHLEIIATTSRVPDYREDVWGHPEPASGLSPYDPGDTFAAGDVTFETILTPGHTPHHVALVARVGGETFALTGDLYTSRPLEAWYESAADDMIASLRRLAALPGELRVLPTHGRHKDDGRRVLSDMADWIDREAEAVLADAARLGTRDHRAIAAARYASLGPDVMDRVSKGEISRAGFVRSVLAPVRTLPATVP